MLRSVGGAAAVNMMLVQCNSDVPISFACSIRWASFLSTAKPGPRPLGTSKARDQAGTSLDPVFSDGIKHRNVRAEFGVILPHPVQDHGDTAGWRFYRARGTTMACKLFSIDSQSARPSTMHRDRCRLEQRALKDYLACLGDPARDVVLDRPVARGRQADPRSDLLRGS
jgi:hypothetical protein